MEVYLDNAATTKVFESVKQSMIETLETNFGNPSSLHRKGVQAEQCIRKAREQIATTLKVDAKEIVFTSGGTESNNMALFGTAYANKRTGNHIITTKIEHPSVLNPLIELEKSGFHITYLSVDNNGLISMDELLQQICEHTILISIIYVNNEIGSVQKISEIGKQIKEKNPNIVFHVDAIQGFGKYKICPRRMNIDLLSASGHKIHGPKGIGFLYIRDKVKIKPILYGGGQQKGMRSGTENVTAIVGFGQAVEEIYKNQENKRLYLYQLKLAFIGRVLKMEKVTVNGIESIEQIEQTAPHIISVSFEGIRSEVLLHALEEKGIYVSSGSACASNHPSFSGTLRAIGVKQTLLDSTLRFSLCSDTTIEEIDYTLEQLEQSVSMLGKYYRL